jgi:hypothetical protein
VTYTLPADPEIKDTFSVVTVFDVAIPGTVLMFTALAFNTIP